MGIRIDYERACEQVIALKDKAADRRMRTKVWIFQFVNQKILHSELCSWHDCCHRIFSLTGTLCGVDKSV